MPFELEIMAPELRAALDIASAVSDIGAKTPSLKTTRIEVTKGRATFVATNSDHSIRASAAAAGKGIVYLDTAMLAQKATALRQTEPVKLSGDDKAVTITQGRTRWKLPLVGGEEFWFADAVDIGGDKVTFSASSLFSAMARSTPMIETSDTRIFGKGLYLDTVDGLRLVAVNNWGCAVIGTDEPIPAAGLIIPNASLAAIRSIFKDATSLDFRSNERAFTLTDGETLYRSKMVEGAFSDWRRVLKTIEGNKSSIRVVTSELLATLDRATSIRDDANKTGRWVGVRVTFKEGECSIRAQNKEGEEGIDYCSCEGGDGTFGMASGRFQLAIESLGSDMVEILLADGEAPVLLRPWPNASKDDFRIVMPLRVAA